MGGSQTAEDSSLFIPVRGGRGEHTTAKTRRIKAHQAMAMELFDDCHGQRDGRLKTDAKAVWATPQPIRDETNCPIAPRTAGHRHRRVVGLAMVRRHG